MNKNAGESIQTHRPLRDTRYWCSKYYL